MPDKGFFLFLGSCLLCLLVWLCLLVGVNSQRYLIKSLNSSNNETTAVFQIRLSASRHKKGNQPSSGGGVFSPLCSGPRQAKENTNDGCDDDAYNDDDSGPGPTSRTGYQQTLR